MRRSDGTTLSDFHHRAMARARPSRRSRREHRPSQSRCQRLSSLQIVSAMNKQCESWRVGAASSGARRRRRSPARAITRTREQPTSSTRCYRTRAAKPIPRRNLAPTHCRPAPLTRPLSVMCSNRPPNALFLGSHRPETTSKDRHTIATSR